MIAEPPLDAPDEDWLVWGDAMQQAGDPRGELIALANHPEQFAVHVSKYADALLGPVLGRHLRKGVIQVAWRRARPDIVELRLEEKSNGRQLLSDLASSRIASLMRGLAITGVTASNRELDLAETMTWFRDAEIPRNWTSLAVIDDRARTARYMNTRDMQPEANLVRFGPLSTLWPSLQHLEELRFVTADPMQLALGTIDLPALRAFTLHGLYWTYGTGQLLATANWPELSSLDLRFVEDFTINDPGDHDAYRAVRGGDDDPFDATYRGNAPSYDLEALFATLESLPLERLALTSFYDGNFMLGLLEQHALPLLAHLDLSDSALSITDLERLGNNPLMLQLEELVLERITAASTKPLAHLDVRIRHSCNPRAPTYRYVVGWE